MKSYIIAARSYNGLTREQWEENNKFELKFEDEPIEENELMRLSKIVFAPGQDGNPTSDISYYLTCGDDGFKEYMKNMLLKKQEGQVISDDPDAAEATVKKNFMTYGEYFDAIDGYVRQQMSGKEE